MDGQRLPLRTNGNDGTVWRGREVRDDPSDGPIAAGKVGEKSCPRPSCSPYG